MAYISFFENFVQIVVLLFAWIVVLLAFFILAIQLFVTLIEFKLTTLAGFVLIPFGLFGKTAFAAERVLGNVISSGVKVLVSRRDRRHWFDLVSRNSPRDSAAISPPSKMPCPWSWRHCPYWGSASSPWDRQRHCCRAVRSSVPALPSGLVFAAAELSPRAVAGAGLAAGTAGGVLAAAARGSASVAAAAPNGVSPIGGAVGGAASNAGGAGQGAASAGTSSANEPPAWARRIKRRRWLVMVHPRQPKAVRSSDHGGGGASVDLSEGKG